MAKTIYERAIEYSRIDLPDGKEGTDKFEKDAYIAGANAMLEEIESIAFSDVGSYKCVLDKIQNKIKELKGE